MDNIRNNEQTKQQDNRTLRDNFKNIPEFKKGCGCADDSGDQEQDQAWKNRELRDNFKNIHRFMKDKGYE